MPGVKGKNRKTRVRQARPKPRRPIRSGRSESIRQALAIVGLVFGAVVVGALGGLGARFVYTALMTSESFAIKKIDVTGNKRVPRDELLRMSGLDEGENIFTVDIEDAARAIKSHPWINGVTVKRHLPDRILIHVVEWNPTAIVRKDGLMLVDSYGEAFKELEPGDPVDMPIISTEKSESEKNEREAILTAFDLMAMAKSSGVVPESNISEIVLSGDWINIVGIHPPYFVKMNRDNITGDWSRLETVVTDAQRSGAEVYGVDLRYRDGAALRLKASPNTLVAGGSHVDAD